MELLIYKRGGGICRTPLEVIPGAERVTQMKVLRVTLRCAASMVALWFLRSHGLPPRQLNEVAGVKTMATVLYASLAWWGFASKGDRGSFERFIGRLSDRGTSLKKHNGSGNSK